MNLTKRLTAKPALLRLCFALSVVLGIGSGSAATITRGPYLQQGTTNSVVVRWRTDVATDSYVRFGTTLGLLTGTTSDAASVTEHVITVSGLQPDTKYFYEVGTSSSWFPGNANVNFVTAPPMGAEKSTRLWVLGDSGTGNANAAAVRNAYLAYASSRSADLLLMLGDNAYNSGTDSEYQSAVFNMYPTVLQNTVLWPTIGNHDTAQSATPPANLPYFNMFTLPQNAEAGGVPSGTEKYYSFDYATIHFICLDSMSSDRTTSGPMYAWLQADLQATTQRWAIAFFHHPPYTKGSHNSDTEGDLIEVRQNLLPLLEAYDVDVVLTGHSHSYERSFLIDGHYGLSTTFAQAHKKDGGDGRVDGNGAYVKPDALTSHQGSVYVVAGSSGQASGGALNHPAMFVSLNQLGSLVIDINSNRLDLVFLKTNALAGDYFTIIKSSPPTNPPAAPTVLNALAFSSSQINLSWIDNSTDEDGFKVERSTNGLDFTQISVIGANVVNGLDTGLAPSTTYYYRVRAYNLAGDSPYSNIAQATTPSGPVSATLIASNSIWKYLDNGTDQGTAWRAAAFNDSAWASGPAELGYGDGGEATIVGFGPNSSAKYITTYFRKSFNVANPAAYTNLLLQLVRDDGAVIYLNGVEVYRVNLPSGTIAFNTLAPLAIGGADETTYFSANLSPANLVTGNNVIAVEMHQNAGNSSDLSFNMHLTASGPGAPAGDTTAPAAVANLAVNSVTASSATLAWTAPGDDGNSGTASSYDVRYSTSPITAANWISATQASGEPAPAIAGTAQTFTVSGLAPGTTYYFAIKTSDEANNISPLSNVPSAATTAIPPNAPTSLAAAAPSSSEVVLSWIDNANNEDGFRIERSTNGVDFVLIGSVGANVTGANDPTVLALTTYHYRVRAFSSAGDSADSNVAQVTTPAPATPSTNVTLVASNAVWKFLDNGTDQGTAWRQPAFNDSTWASGAAELGYGDGGEATIVSFGPNASAKYITTYFRKSFTVSNPGGFTNLLLQLVRDDGAVVYLNGVEVYRNNLPAGAITFTTLAPVAIGDVDESTYQIANLSPSALVSGANVIAVEMHQANGTSTDVSFNLQLTGQGAGTPADTIAPAAVVNLATGNATTNSITLTWTAPGDDGNTGTASSYDVRLSLAPITEANWNSATPVIGEPVPGAAGTPENLTIIQLSPAATYYFALKTSDETNNVSPLSNVASATTVDPASLPVTTVLLASNFVWKYLDNGTDQGTAWRSPAFDESTWASGLAELGYGDGGEATVVGFGPDVNNKYITTYFRAAFTIGNPAAYTNLSLQLVRDDGAVVYLNGVEVYRNNLPAGGITFTTLALTAIGGADETAFQSANIPASALVAGVNVIAVEMHQSAGTSSDVSFNLELAGTGPVIAAPPAPSALSASAVSPSQIDLTWADNSAYEDGFHIERALATGGSFSEIATVGIDVTTFSDTNLSANTTYFYRVSAFNGAGASAASNETSATTPPPPDVTPPAAVVNLAVASVTSTSVTLTWTAPGNDGAIGTASAYDVRYSATPITEANWNTATQVSGVQSPSAAGSVESFTVSGLSSDAAYFFALKASDETNNISPLSNIASATTLPPPDVTPPAAVADFGIASATSTSATLTWTAPGDDGVSGTASAYDVRYSTAPITEGNWNAATQVAGEPNPSAAGSADSFTVSGLNSDTTYYFALKTSDETNNISLLSNIASATTPDVTAPAAVANLAVASVTSGSATLTWSAPGDDGNTGIASAYDVRYSTTPITTANWASATPATGEPTPAVAGSAQSFAVAGLSSGTTYYFALQTSDEANNLSPLSNVAIATTPDLTAPAAVANLAIASVTSGSATLTWTAPGDDGAIGTASAYDVRYSTVPITAANWASATQATGEPTPTVAGSEQSFVITGLSSGKTYYFALKTSDESSNISPLSNVASAATPLPPDSTAPAAVANLAVTSVTSNRATLTWTAPGDDGVTGIATAYDIRYSTAPITAANWSSASQVTGEPAPSVAGSAQTFAVTGLNNGTTYYFAIKTTDEKNNISPISNVPLATTAGVPAPWLTQDIGSVGAAGSANHTNGVFTVRGSGTDISSSADEFRYVYQAANGDCEIIARVAAVQNTRDDAKAAVMIRESLSANSRHATMAVTADDGLTYLRRTSAGGSTSSTSGGSSSAPYWIRLVRSGSTFTAYRSANGTTWTTVGSNTITMGANVYIGLAVTSRRDGTVNTSRFDNVRATP